MRRRRLPSTGSWATFALAAALLAFPRAALANGGPFVLRYPNGDPAAKGVLARLHPTLKPGRETRLRVLHEDLTIRFAEPRYAPGRSSDKRAAPPLVEVTAAYRIENATGKVVDVDFGFPILRGIYIPLYAMFAAPSVRVTVDGKHAQSRVISNSVLYGVIRKLARQVIDAAIAADVELAEQVRNVRLVAEGKRRAPSHLRSFLRGKRGWSARDATLLAAYARLELDRGPRNFAFGDMLAWLAGQDAGRLARANLGVLAAIGEQKATQLFARLAGLFDSTAAHTYESIFRAWGGDVRERSLDLRSGRVRPREVAQSMWGERSKSPSVYARVEYLDRNANLLPEERELCASVLRNLPVVFTYAPMNLLHYRVSFPARTTRTVTVRYEQHAYVDTRAPRSYQLAYVLHPASLWKDFGPIRLRVEVPRGVPVRATVPLRRTSAAAPVSSPEVVRWLRARSGGKRGAVDAWAGARVPKVGELLVAVDAEGWAGRAPGWSPGAAAKIEPPPARPRETRAPGALVGQTATPRSSSASGSALGWLLPVLAGGLAAAAVLLGALLRRRRASGA